MLVHLLGVWMHHNYFQGHLLLLDTLFHHHGDRGGGGGVEQVGAEARMLFCTLEFGAQRGIVVEELSQFPLKRGEVQ